MTLNDINAAASASPSQRNDDRSSTVLIVGGGVVGGSFAEALARRGVSVQVVEPNPARRTMLAEMGLRVYASIDDVDAFDVAFFCVPTPSTTDGYNLSFVRQAISDLATWLHRHPDAAPIVAIRSTVTPGTTDTVVAPILAGTRARLAAVPEYLREAVAVEDALNPRAQVIGARDPQVRAALVAVLASLGGKVIEFDTPTAAELAKCVHNNFNAAKISFFNEIHGLAADAGLDANQIAEAVAFTAEASWNPQYGIKGGYPFGGNCLPKDLDGLIAYGDEHGHDLPLLRAVREVNMRFQGRSSES